MKLRKNLWVGGQWGKKDDLEEVLRLAAVLKAPVDTDEPEGLFQTIWSMILPTDIQVFNAGKKLSGGFFFFFSPPPHIQFFGFCF